jgi:hypothetical protein
MNTKLTDKDIARFWSKIVRHDDGCWSWIGATRNGYGVINIRGTVTYAHRLMYELTHGEIQDGRFVLHHCDNPPCSRPDHLYSGTQFQNLADMTSRGRRRKPFSVLERTVPVRGSDPLRFARFRERQRAKRAMLPKVPCACGCGEQIPAINSMKQPARYALGHNPGGESTRFKAGTSHQPTSAR